MPVKVGSMILLLAFALWLGGCSHAGSPRWSEPDPGVSPRRELADVPFYPQEAYQCGPAALAMALEWSGRRVDLTALTGQVYTPALKGSLQPALIAGARRNGRLAYAISGADALFIEIDAGHPVIVLQNLGLFWSPLWHYAVVIGYDMDQQVMWLHSGETKKKTTSLGLFRRTWDRSEYWGLLVLPPDVLPATAEESLFVEAAIGLEQAGQPKAAADAYRAALKKWPDNKTARIGLGNSCYAAGDLACAEAAFREATRRFSGDGVAFNNLATVLFETGQHEEAMAAARQAVALGGPLEATFKETLREIEKEVRKDAK